MSESTNQLFLLEILVQNAKIDKICLENNINVYLEARFGELPCFSLYPEGSNGPDDEGYGTQEVIHFSCGKTCLFLMNPEKLVRMIRECPIILGVVRMKEVATEPEIIAQAEINLTGDMLDMVQESMSDCSSTPISEFLERSFDLLDQNQDDVGDIEVFVRLTSLGCSVLTQVKMSQDQKFQFEKEPKFVDLACKGCAAGRPGPDMAIADVLEKCESVKSQEGITNENQLQPKCSQLCRETNASVQTKEKESCCKASGKTETIKKLDEKKILAPKVKEIFREVEKVKKKKIKKGIYAPGGPDVSYPGIMVGHQICQHKDCLVPARQGWAWKKALPEGLKLVDRSGWQPGYFRKSYLRSLKIRPQIKMLRRQTETKTEAPIFSKKPTLHILRKDGEYRLTINPPGGKETKKYNYPANMSDSDLELNLNLPESFPTPPPKLKHQAQQFCEEDFMDKKAEEKVKKVKKGKKGKKEVKKEKGPNKQKAKKKGEDLSQFEPMVKPWDNWVLKLKCPNKKEKKKLKDGKKNKEKSTRNK